jgi:hypothetical protein
LNPPVILSVTANPNQLWPANNKPINVKITVVPSNIVGTTTYSVVDEYNQYNVSERPLPSDGIISLLADKKGDDKDGRVYTITIKVSSAGRLSATGSVIVTVPHDQGKK